jgi:hypothetical protein
MTGSVDPARYEELIERLLDLQVRESSLDALTASFEALSAVLRFLNTDVRLVQTGATKVLARLELALLDRSRGAKPKLFFDVPNRMGARGAPSYTSSAILRAIVNAGFLSLCGAGVSKLEAGRWLAARLKHAGLKQPSGRVIGARAIARWRAELGGKSLKGSDETFAMFVLAQQPTLQAESPKEHPDVPLTAQQARSFAAVLIKSLKIAGF